MEESKTPWVIGLVVALIIIIGGYGIYRYVKKDTPIVLENQNSTGNSTKNTGTTTSPILVPTSAPTPVILPTTVYKNGTYSAVGDYFSPGGAEHIDVTVTLKNDVIVGAEVQGNNPSGGTARRYQGIFIANFKGVVIGKSIDKVILDKVSGSSLTPKGWNEAIVEIKVSAKA